MHLAAGVHEGDILAGKYRVERVLGVGGMGVVVAAHHMQLDSKVAIKFLLPEMLSHAEVVGRFAREAQAAVKIKSEHVARVIDVGTLETGAPYMVMEFLEGSDLGGWLEQRGPLPIEQAIDFVLQATVAVAEAHSLGIVHRDLKPANLFCVRGADGRLAIKVLDFGISKMTNPANVAAVSFTRTSAVMGSPYYMSPEQMRSPKEVDARTDIWAMGVVLFELLTRSVPFQGETQAEVCVKIVTEPPPPIRDLRPEIPLGLADVILKCLEKDRNKRYRNVAEMALGLLPFAPKHAKASVEKVAGIIQAAGLSSTALSVPQTPHASGERPASQTIAPLGRTVFASSRRNVALACVVGAAGIAAVVAGVGSRARSGKEALDSRPSAAASPQAALLPVTPPAATAEKPPAETAPAPLPALSPVAASASASAPRHTSTKASPKAPSPMASAAPTVPPAPAVEVAPIAPAPTPQDPLQSLRIKK
jgi:eukaryotic-like serine/threonine-protein kinase